MEMATVLRFPQQIPPRPGTLDAAMKRASAAIVILPCVRREALVAKAN
ncbi:hypothetical protein GCM10011390_10770 [Aureimonas endophytica]|uniref:Uncharacterized protein n=1 Tax=Aureimonas endophytica TaxID=2027858 RepID=A0A916ZF74_9HYPH|nr:hypothetical protein [Aureimonas endophytica]GGD93903.1 hypothetical protein GCM10011390_10770 [Aureimonas endophytica]